MGGVDLGIKGDQEPALADVHREIIRLRRNARTVVINSEVGGSHNATVESRMR